MDQKNYTKLPENVLQSINNTDKPPEIVQILEENNKLQNNAIKPPGFIKEKWKYIKFKRTVEKNGYTSARLMAQSIGVHKDTISKWLRTPAIQLAMAQTINSYVSDIQSSKDWKAKAYLLDKIVPSDKEIDGHIDLKQLIVINTTK